MTREPEILADDLVRRLRAAGSLAVAYSGGADSALVVAAAARALGPAHVLAITAVSESLASGELSAAGAVPQALGVTHRTVRTRELERDGYRANGRDRCYFCKSEVLDALARFAAGRGYHRLATGTNADDAADPYRPGIKAGHERGVSTPLLDAGLTKADVRAVSRLWSLPTWDKPATPCLASRIRYGLEVTGARLARIDRAEASLRELLSRAGVAVADLRVRDLGGTARIELPAEQLTAARTLPGVGQALADAGFGDADVTWAAFRSGNLNNPGAVS